MLLVDKRAQRGIRNIYAIGIDFEFSARSTILENKSNLSKIVYIMI